MIKAIEVRNFKSWRTPGEVRLAPVTLILGTNSSGKSSLLQPILLLKQTAFSADRSIHLNLGGDTNDHIDVGSFNTLLHHDADPPRLGIRLRIGDAGTSNELRFEAEYQRDSAFNPVIASVKLADQDHEYRAIRREGAAYSIYHEANTQAVGKSRSFTPERSIAFSAEAVSKLGEYGTAVQDISLGMRRQLERVIYLGPLRTKPLRDFPWNHATPGLLEEDGRNVPAILAAASESKKDPVLQDLLGNVSVWLKKMGLADELVIKGGPRYRIELRIGSQHVNLKDVGIGVSQVLPVLVAAHFSPPGSTILLEEPEIHLHPLAQAELAEMLVSTSKERNVQFLVETHSEHLFRRLQTIIARDDLEPDDTALYFVRRADGCSEIESLAPDDFGRIQNWPANFFGRAMEETAQQMKYAMQKQAEKHSRGTV